MSIPIYRAKKKDTDEWIEGFYIHVRNTEYHYMQDGTHINTEEWTSTPTAFKKDRIDETTLAIHFPKKNMFDKNGKMIFISLGDGIGGDISSESNRPLTMDDFPIFGYEFEVIGIHKG